MVVLLVVNIFFLALLIVTQVDPDIVSERVRTAFDNGDLLTEDYLPFDARRGWHQYTDCSALQMLSNENPSRLARALSPVIFAADEGWSVQCALLHKIVVERADRETLLEARYSRYWHGYNAIAASALRVMDLADLRRMLSGVMWLAITVLFLVAYLRRNQIRLVGTSIAVVAATLWAAPFFSPNLTHGPGDALVLLFVAGIAAQPRIASSLEAIVPYSAAFGAAVVFLEANTGQLAVGAAWLTAMTLAAGHHQKMVRFIEPRSAAIAALLAFGLAAVATGVLKQVISGLLSDPGAGGTFLSHLRMYMRVPEPEEGWPGLLVPFGRMVRKSTTLTYGSALAGCVLIAVTVLAWITAVARELLRRHRELLLDLLVLVIAALMPIAWILLMPTAAYVHAVFWVRSLVAAIALAPVALLWPYIRQAHITNQ
jgi:hypothetical protein